jgi:putative flippase GtrA
MQSMQPKALARNFLSRPGGRYLVVGVSVYALELAIIVIAQHLGAGSVLAVALSYIIGTTVSFGLQKLFTFGDKRMHHKILTVQALAVGGLLLFNFGFTLLATKLLQDVLPAVVVRTLALLTTTIWNFFLYKTRIFKQSGPEPIT